jgi:trigger factor
MSYQIEDLGKNMAKITIECPAEDFDAAIVKAYQKNKNKINVPGFRKGKAPLAMIEKMYGPEMFYEDAANDIIPGAYEKVADECEIDIVSRPEINVTNIKKGEAFIFTATVAVKPSVELGEYKGLEVPKTDVTVTDEEVEADIQKTLEQNAKKVEVTDRPVESGDATVIDFEGFVDGVAFDGGKGLDYPLTIGSGAFIPGFEDQIIGKNIGEEFDVNVTFPEDYQAENLKGKPAVFKVTVKSITKTVVGVADDEFADEVSENCSTIAEYREEVRTKLADAKAKQAATKKEDEAVKKAANNATIDIPQPMIEAHKEQMANDFAYRLQSQGLSVEQYFQFTGLDGKKFLDTLEPQAITRIKTRLTLEAIADAEGIEASEDDLAEEFENMAKQYNMEVDKVKEALGEQTETIKDDIRVKKAAKLVTDAAVEVASEDK